MQIGTKPPCKTQKRRPQASFLEVFQFSGFSSRKYRQLR